MVKHILVIFCVAFCFFSGIKAQCPQIYNSSGTATSAPTFVYCSGGPYNMNIQSPSNFPAYTINWGDGSPNSTGVSYAAMSLIPHTYAATVGTFVITLTVPLSACTLTMLVVSELPSGGGISVFGGNGYVCAPGTVTLTNNCTNPSPTTTYFWDFGDGTTQLFGPSNYLQNIVHTFSAGTVTNCKRTISVTAFNYCKPLGAQAGVDVDIYDIENNIAINVDAITKCLPDNIFTFSNGTAPLNCFPEGNNTQRQERWNVGDKWGKGVDSIIGWRPFPPALPFSIAYPPVIGSHQVMLVDSNKCGLKTTSLTVNIVNPPVAGLIAPLTVCQNAAATFSNSSATGPGIAYKWNFGTNSVFNNIGGGNKTITYGTPGTYTVRVVVFINGSNASCSDTASAVINVLAAPVSNFSFSPATGCSSITGVTFSNSSTNANTYTWTFGNSNTSFLQTPPPQNYNLPGAYTVSLAVTATTGCIHTKTGKVTVYSTPVPNFPVFTNCVNSVSSFSNTSTVTGTAAINSYTWNFGDGSPKTNTQNPTHTYTLANTYTVKLIVATAFCRDSITKSISINLRPTPNFVFTPTINCPPFPITFSNTTLNGVNYLWRFGTAPTATSNLAAPSFTYLNTTQTTQTYSITLISSTGVGCADSVKKIIRVYPKPVASFTTNGIAGCSPIAINFTNTSIGATTYSWNFGDGGSTTQTNTAHTYTNVGLSLQTRTVELFVNNSFGCKDTVRLQLQVYPEPLSNFTLTPGSGCHPLAVNFSPALGAISYTWNYGDGSSISNATNPPHTYTNTGTNDQTFTVTLGTTNAFGCFAFATATATVFGTPVANFIHSPNAGCTPMSVTFTNTSQLNNTNSWNFGNGLVSSAVDPVITYTNLPGSGSQVFNITLTVTTSNGCTDFVTKQVSLLKQPKSVFTLDTPACAPKIIQFQNNSIDNNASLWSFGDNTQSTLDSPQKLYTNSTAFNLVFNVTLMVTSNDGCIHTSTVPLVIHPKPVFFVISAPDSGCSPLKVNFSKVVGAVKYTWDFYKDPAVPKVVTTGSISNTFINKTGFDQSYQVEMIAEDQFGCKDTANRTIKVFPNPIALFRADPLKVYIPNEATNFIDLSSLASIYQWDFGDGGKSNEKQPSHTYTSPGEYVVTLTVTSAKGCVDSYRLPEKVEALDETQVVLPNAFTPNATGSPGSVYDPLATNNDIFHPQIRGTEKYNFSVFSRWGELLFDTKNPDEGWDGYYKGKLCIQDVYIWKISATFVDGKTYNKTGDVLLLR
jgi:PKD repeat protein